MQSLLIAVPAFIFVLSVLVFVHEWGHYFVAKLCGVRVDVFSLGFGKRIWGFRRGDTDYRVSILPIGGYVKMAGDNPLETRTGDPGEFMSHPRWQRFLISVAGPAMNVMLAVAIFTGLNIFHNEEYVYLSQPAVVGLVKDGSPAQKAGIQPGDRITKIQDTNNPVWEQVEFKVLLNPNQPIEVTVQRGDQTLQKSILPDTDSNHLGDVGWSAESPAIITMVEPGYPAEKAGIKEGDQIVALDGQPVLTDQAVFPFVLQNKEKPIKISVLRNSQRLDFNITPRLSTDPGSSQARYRVGILVPPATRITRLSFGPAFSKAAQQSRTYSLLLFDLVGKLFQRKISVKTLESPVGIMRDTSRAAKAGWPTLLTLMAALSLNLAVFNVLPIPILDGGTMLMLLVESVMRRDIKQEVKERLYQVAFVFIVLLLAVVVYNDVAKLPVISRYMP